MKVGARVMWFGYELIVVAFVCELAGNYYFWATLNGREDMYALPTPDHDKEFHHQPTRFPKNRERSTKSSMQWLNSTTKTRKRNRS